MGGYYDEYLNSRTWERRKLRYWEDNSRYCNLCGSEQKTILHHLRYRNLGNEPDEDLCPLCRKCHNDVHQFAKDHRIPIAEATEILLGRVYDPKPNKREERPFVPIRLRMTQEQREAEEFYGIPVRLIK